MGSCRAVKIRRGVVQKMTMHENGGKFRRSLEGRGSMQSSHKGSHVRNFGRCPANGREA